MEAGGVSVSLVEKDFALSPVGEQFLFDEYLEMAIQFGFCTLFVSAFPLAPFFALCNNILEIRLDAFKFIVSQRKPIPHPARSIGIWYTILDLISKLSVLSNACVIAFTSDFIIPRLYYQFHSEVGIEGYLERSMGYFDATGIHLKITQHANTTVCRYRGSRLSPCSLNATFGQFHESQCTQDSSQGYPYSNDFFYILVCRLLFVLIFEHLVLSIKALAAYIIPDVPSRIVVQLQRERYLARQAILQRVDENSTTINSATRGGSQAEMTDSEAVAYQPGADLVGGQELEPSSALKRMYSNRRRPSMTSAHSAAQAQQAESVPTTPNTLSPNDSSPNLHARAKPRFSAPGRHEPQRFRAVVPDGPRLAHPPQALFVVDAFTSRPFGGNAAAVVISQKDDEPSEDLKQRLASEFNLSETAFPIPLDSDDFAEATRFQLRWFTPKHEVPLCGHATLATAHVIIKELENRNEKLFFETRESGTLVVSCTESPTGQHLIAMEMPLLQPLTLESVEPRLTSTFETLDDPQEIGKRIAEAVAGGLPIAQVVYTPKVKYLLVALDDKTTRAQFEAIKPSAHELLSIDPEGDLVQGVMITFRPPSTEHVMTEELQLIPPTDFLIRFFSPWHAQLEDPATGSAQCIASPFWSKVIGKTELKAHQHFEGRGAQLYTEILWEENVVVVKGAAVTTLSGTVGVF
ncbi:Anoctamin [Aphelenchoides fujianensis]|nr:Anoctamin [Aphelenchoides fujianensis]